MTDSLHLLLLIGALCGPTVAFVNNRAERQRVTDVLTEKLFTVSDMLTTMERHVQRLDSWESSVGELTTQLNALKSGQEQIATQLASVLRQVENVTDSTAGMFTELSSLAESQASTAAELRTLRADLSPSISDLTGSVSGLVDSQAAQHERTRDTCGQSGAQLSAPLAELRTAVKGAAQLAERTEQALTANLGQVGGQLQAVSQQLGSLSEQLQLDREMRLTTTTPAPTVDPLKIFLDDLNKSLLKRKEDESLSEGGDQ